MARSNSKIWLIVLIILGLLVGGSLFLKKKDKNPNSNNTVNNIVKSNTLRVAVGGEPASLDPNLINGTWENKIDVNIFEGLATKAANGSILPGVASKWVVSKDGKTYTFYLRKNAKWSDGKPVTAHDFVYSIKRMLNPKTAASYANLLYVIQGAEAYNTSKGKESNVKVAALDDHTLQITLNSPIVFFIELVAHSSFLPIPKHVVEKKGKAWSQVENIVTNGAYKVVAWKPKAYVELAKNSYYWDKDNVSIDKVLVYTQDDNASLLKRYRADEIDILPDLSVESYSWAVENIKSDLRVFPYLATSFYAINLKDEKFKNPKTRLALNMAIDRDFITQKVLKSPEIPVTYSFVPPGIKGYPTIKPEWANWPMDKRLSEAKKLLKEAGYTESNPLSFSISYNTLESNKQIAVAMAAMWKRLGVKTQLFNKEVAVHYADMLSGNYEVSRGAWVADYVDPSSFIMLFTSTSGNNYLSFKNPKYDDYYKKALHFSTPKLAMQNYKDAEQILLDSNAIIPLYNYVAKTLVKPWVKGYEANNLSLHLIKYMSLSH